MEAGPAGAEQAFLADLRRRRADLLESIGAVEQALAAPVPGRESRWVERVGVALVELSADFREHIGYTEGADGFYQGLLETAPRLSGPVTRLVREHALITDLIDNLLSRVGQADAADGIEEIRERGTVLLGRLVRHRQHGSDLIYEAYAADIGGET